MSKQTETLSGTVQWFDAHKGFGFIAIDDGDRDIFMHASQLVDADWVPGKGDCVSFVEDVGLNGRPYARRVVQNAF